MWAVSEKTNVETEHLIYPLSSLVSIKHPSFHYFQIRKREYWILKILGCRLRGDAQPLPRRLVLHNPRQLEHCRESFQIFVQQQNWQSPFNSAWRTQECLAMIAKRYFEPLLHRFTKWVLRRTMTRSILMPPPIHIDRMKLCVHLELLTP